MITQSILWRGIQWPGHEALCEETWNTLRARISGWVGDRTADIDLVVDPKHRWRLNGIEHPTVAGCIDLDLNFSPSTNESMNQPIGMKVEEDNLWPT